MVPLAARREPCEPDPKRCDALAARRLPGAFDYWLNSHQIVRSITLDLQPSLQNSDHRWLQTANVAVSSPCLKWTLPLGLQQACVIVSCAHSCNGMC